MIKDERGDNLVSIQFLRGIAAILVVLHHAIGGSSYLSPSNIIAIIANNGWMGVEIFFIISGFIIPYSMHQKNYKLYDFKIFFLKRIARIEPPYLVSIVLVLLLNWSNTWSSWYHGPAYQVNWLNTLGHLGYLNAFTKQPWLNLAYWTLAIEFEYYIVMALLYPLITNANKKIMFITFFSLLALTFVSIPLRRMHIPVYFPFFLTGIAFFLFKCNKISTRDFFILVISCLITCYYVHGAILTGVSIGALLCIKYIRIVPKVFLLLGTISYSLYLTHSVLITRIIALSGRFLKITNMGVKVTIAICFCLVFAYIYYLVVEKPFHKLSKRIKYRHNT